MIGETSILEKMTECEAAIATEYLIAKPGSDDNKHVVAAGATDALVGIFQHTTTVIGESVRLMLEGISRCVYGGNVTRGDPLTSDANAKAVKAALGQNVIGFAMTSGVNGNIGFVLLSPGVIAPSMAADGLVFKGLARATFDATAGKTIGTHNLGVSLPDNAIVTRSFYEVLTTFASSTDAATIALGVETDAAVGIKAAVAISDGANPWDAGNHEGIQEGTAANFLTKLTAVRELIATVAVEDLTDGKLILYCEYVVSI